MTEPDTELAGKNILLTGATGGVGRAIAERLAASGARLALLGRRGGVLEELADTTGGVWLSGDLRDDGFLGTLPERLASWDAPDVLINNAGVFALAPFARTSVSDFDEHLAVNLRAPFRLISMWLPAMVERGAGQIVNVGSVAGRVGLPGNAAYSASKFGLRALHEVLAQEVRGSGVRVIWIEPSAVDTSVWDPHDPDGRADLPSRADMLEPAAVAEAVHFAVTRPSAVSVQEIVIRSNT